MNDNSSDDNSITRAMLVVDIIREEVKNKIILKKVLSLD